MVPIRKERAGSSNLGYTWSEDGAVVEVTPEHARLLLSIPDGDFSAVADHAPVEPESDLTVEEPAPEAPIDEAPAPRKAPAKKTAAKKASAAPEQASVEE